MSRLLVLVFALISLVGCGDDDAPPNPWGSAGFVAWARSKVRGSTAAAAACAGAGVGAAPGLKIERVSGAARRGGFAGRSKLAKRAANRGSTDVGFSSH